MHAIPGSGKSTLANKICEHNSPCVILSTDDVQSDQNGVYLYSADYMGLAHKINLAKTKEACRRGLNIVVDNTNLVAKECKPYYDLANEYGYEFQLVEPTTAWANDIDECFKRNTHGVPRETLERMKKRRQSIDRIMDQLKKNQITPTVPDKVEYIEGLPTCIIVDMDGTLAKNNGHRPFYDASTSDMDEPNTPIIDLVKELGAGFCGNAAAQIIIMSGREQKDQAPTERFLKKYHVPYDLICMRNTGDNRKDAIVKKELFDKYIRGKYNVWFVLDDRDSVVDMWRNTLNLTCLQVDYGNF